MDLAGEFAQPPCREHTPRQSRLASAHVVRRGEGVGWAVPASHPLVARVAVFAVAFGLWLGLFALRGARGRRPRPPAPGDGALANKWLYTHALTSREG